MRLKKSSAKWRLFIFCLNVLKLYVPILLMYARKNHQPSVYSSQMVSNAEYVVVLKRIHSNVTDTLVQRNQKKKLTKKQMHHVNRIASFV